MRRLLSVLTVGALLLAGCGGSDSDISMKALTDAIKAVTEMDAVTVTFTLDSTPESLQALTEEEGSVAEDEANAILNSSIVISGAGEGPDATFMFVVVVDGEQAVDVRVVDQVLYVRADVPGLVDRFGGDPAEFEVAAAQASAAGFDFVGPLLDGEWLAVDFGRLQEQFGGQLPSPAAGRDETLEEFNSILRDTASISSLGTDDVGEHVVVSVRLREAYERVIDDIASLGAQGVPFPDISEVPEKDVRVDAWIDDGRLRQVELDLLQFDELTEDTEFPEGVEELGVRMTIEEFDGVVEAPSDAIRLDVQKLMQDFFGLMMGGGAGFEEPAEPQFDALCKQLEGQPRQILKLYKEQCPDLLKK